MTPLPECQALAYNQRPGKELRERVDNQAWGTNRSLSMKLASAFMPCREQSGEPSFDAIHENERDGCREGAPLLGRRLELERHLHSPDAVTRFQHEARRVNLVGTRAYGAVPVDDLLELRHLVLGQTPSFNNGEDVVGGHGFVTRCVTNPRRWRK